MNTCTPSVHSKTTFASNIHAMITLPIYSSYADLPSSSRIRRKPKWYSSQPCLSRKVRMSLDTDYYGPYINAV